MSTFKKVKTMMDEANFRRAMDLLKEYSSKRSLPESAKPHLRRLVNFTKELQVGEHTLMDVERELRLAEFMVLHFPEDMVLEKT